MNSNDWTQDIAACVLEDAPGVMTLFYANGDINNGRHMMNAVMRPRRTGPFISRHTQLGFRFDRVLDMTETIVCADLDGNGLADTIFVANLGGHDVLYRYSPQ